MKPFRSRTGDDRYRNAEQTRSGFAAQLRQSLFFEQPM
jgi:hypothetical protein